jgi:hypothetical protein
MTGRDPETPFGLRKSICAAIGDRHNLQFFLNGLWRRYPLRY